MGILRLKELLKENELTGKELAERVGVSKTSISQIITENQQPRFELLVDIAKALDVDVKDLFNSTKPEKEPKEMIQDLISTLEDLKDRV